ncbi:hypothetical protein [Profundibacterium mesophilum]|uniref:Uncharacterized protein n=1 Tax=Profundibacterium mesophilum KAUST100406-0324 TaxID=1037889 RepID=A0A921NSS2_9RHOB|nr:hypothetical protein [Profundibacterium mesophilum]KAF0674800.1 hypothetical protein PMES_02876 [Profundibacterium mesophilum KAUST100406-0324]
MTFLDRLHQRARQRGEYERTRREIAALPRDVALDLDIYPGDAHRIAWKAVYGV